MKKIINGRKYDTETANSIDYVNKGTDLYHRYEELYQKKTSEFFLYVYDRYDDYEKIIPLSEEEAKKWLEEYGDGDTYEKVFGEVEE